MKNLHKANARLTHDLRKTGEIYLRRTYTGFARQMKYTYTGLTQDLRKTGLVVES